MKLSLAILALTALTAVGEESYFFDRASKAKNFEKRIEGEQLHILIPIKRIAAPKATSIYALHQGLGLGRKYQIQIDLEKTPEKGWLPMLKLGDDVIDGGIYLSLSDKEGASSSLHIESDDPEKIRRWCKLLGTLMEIPEGQIEIDLTNGEQGGADQPATAPQLKSDGKEKPQHESKPTPR
jgi:hypothetical protein